MGVEVRQEVTARCSWNLRAAHTKKRLNSVFHWLTGILAWTQSTRALT